VCAEVKDTCKIQTQKIDIKSNIFNEIFKSFVEVEFFKLAKFCSGYVDFSLVYNDKEHTETSTEYKGLQSLTQIISQTEYTKFKLIRGQTQGGEDLIMCSLFKFEDSVESNLNIIFVLNYKCEINKIILF
jgi:hypothetical protein